MSEAKGFDSKALQRLQSFAEVVLADATRDTLLAEIHEADALWIRLRHRIDETVLQAAPNLKVIITPTTGLNHIDLEAAKARGIRVLSLRGEVDFLKDVRATAELTIGLMLSLLRQLPAAIDHVQTGQWNRDLFQGRELCGQTIGIVGYGRLGTLVAKYLHAFDARILASDPHLSATAYPAYVEPVSLSRLLAESAIVSMHVNLDAATTGFFGAREFQSMQPGAWFINTARGELIDEKALLAALRSGHLGGAALDVLCHENAAGMHEHPLVQYAREHRHLLVTPHLGGCTAESMAKTETFMVDKFIQAWPTVAANAQTPALTIS
jgi:D-3-phosphoglycerate dehydrogenase